ncbi:MAG TPA: hypothetical protein VGA84_04940 [Thermoanaerobaculia bacterium]
MKKETFLKKAVAGLGSAALVIAMGACAHHTSTADQGYGQIRTEEPATPPSSGTTVAAVAAPANAEGVTTPSTPAVISGPAAVDSSGRAYTSSSVGSAGNSNTVGTNTNVNLVPQKTSSDVTVTQSAATIETPVVTETPAPAPVIAETPAPAPIVETPAPVVETPMASSTTETATTTTETTKHHRRMRKD